MAISVMRNDSEFKLAYPRNRESIRRDTFLLRSKIGLKNKLYFPIIHFLENVLPQTDPSFLLEIVNDDELLGIQAEYVPRMNVIRVRQSVYEAAAAGFWWARSTLAHELGHYYYHDEKNVRYAKLDFGQKVPPDFDPERQANVFAAELLVPVNLIDGMSIGEVGKACGVSFTIAKRQLLIVDRIKKRQKKKREKKKRRSSPRT